MCKDKMKTLKVFFSIAMPSLSTALQSEAKDRKCESAPFKDVFIHLEKNIGDNDAEIEDLLFNYNAKFKHSLTN